MSLADRIEGAKLTEEELGSAKVGAYNRTEIDPDGGYRFVAKAQHAKDKSELFYGVVEWLEGLEEGIGLDVMEQHYVDRGHGGRVFAEKLLQLLRVLEIPKPEWIS